MKKILIALACLLAAAPAVAQLYRWVDEKGRVQYSDKPPPGAKARAVEGTAPPEPKKAAAAPPAQKVPPPFRGPVSRGDPAAEAREKKKATEKKAREAQARIDRQPACDAAKESLRFAERNKLSHEKKGSKKAVEYTNEEQIEEIHKRRRAATAACY